jgi:hypothetical protein
MTIKIIQGLWKEGMKKKIIVKGHVAFWNFRSHFEPLGLLPLMTQRFVGIESKRYLKLKALLVIFLQNQVAYF